MGSRERSGRARARLAVEATYDLEAERNEHERERDDQESLEQIGPGRRNQSSDEAARHEHDRHRHDDLVRADTPPVAWLMTLPAPFSMLPMLMMKKQSANTI